MLQNQNRIVRVVAAKRREVFGCERLFLEQKRRALVEQCAAFVQECFSVSVRIVDQLLHADVNLARRLFGIVLLPHPDQARDIGHLVEIVRISNKVVSRGYFGPHYIGSSSKVRFLGGAP